MQVLQVVLERDFMDFLVDTVKVYVGLVYY